MDSPNGRIIHVMKHATAWPQRYRNHFCAGPGHSDWGALQDAVESGWMVDRGAVAMWGNDHCFQVTDEGVRYLSSLEAR